MVRGLFRLWLVCSAAWIVGSAYVLSQQKQGIIEQYMNVPPPTVADIFSRSVTFEWILLPPIAALIAGAVCQWVIRGFKHSN
jgi:hypothetical protein